MKYFIRVHAYGFEDEARRVLVEDDLGNRRVSIAGCDSKFQQPFGASVKSRGCCRRSGFVLTNSGGAKMMKSIRSNDPLLYAVPLSVKADVFGVLLLQEASGGRRFRARRLEIINGIAQQAALAIQNDRLQKEMVVRERLETEVQLARQIQQTFIPESLPQHSGWELAARWKTARQVGGDFYDVMELPNQKLGLFIADVADKGMPAALFMALTRTLVRAAVIETPSPAEALQRVNELLMPDTKQGMFVTAVYAVLDLRHRRIDLCQCGT